MNLAIGIILMWLAFACLWISSHGTDSKTPWEAVQQIVKAVGGGGNGGTP
jgi:hypothetical protein